MARKPGEAIQTMNPTEAAKALAKLVELTLRRELAERADEMRLVEAAARCGALFSGREGATWGVA